MAPESKFSDGVLPHFLSKYFQEKLDLVLHRLIKPWIYALEEEDKGIDGADLLDCLSKSNAMLTVSSTGVTCPRGVYDGDARIAFVSQVMTHHPACLIGVGSCAMAHTKPMFWCKVLLPCGSVPTPSTILGAESFFLVVF